MMIKIIRKIMDVVLVLIIILLGSYIVLSHVHKIMIYRVKTGSMEENIHIGDYILIIEKSKYNIGDVVTYKTNGGFITHRIIAREGNEIITKGDANNVEDEKINESIIVGKVMISGGILNIVINYKYAIVGVLLSLYLFSSYFSRNREAEN